MQVYDTEWDNIAMDCKTSTIEPNEILPCEPVLLTANRRLALYHQNRFNEKQIALKKNSWCTPSILPLKNWLLHLWENHCQEDSLLLSEHQELLLWQEIIERSELVLLNSQNSAKLAQSAYETLLLWNLSLEDLSQEKNEQVRQFYHWALEFEKIGGLKHWKIYPQILKELFDKQSHIPLPSQLILEGFEDFAPAYTRLLENRATIAKPRYQQAKIQRCLFENTEAEILAMALWSKEEIAKNSTIKIGCVVPNLAQIRNSVEAIFTSVFAQENLLQAREKTRFIFNISAGEALLHYEIIRIAQGLFECVDEEISLDTLGHLLQSPYLSVHESDVMIGALSHAHLLKMGCSSIPLAELYVPLNEYFESYPKNTWLSRLRLFSEKSKDLSPRSPSRWADFFIVSLEAMQWPGQRPLDSQDYQLCKRLFEIFGEIRALDYIYSEIEFHKARQIFNNLLQETIFQPQSTPAFIQILGSLESAGFEFDALWVMGLHDEVWPPAASPHPFLPYEMQKKWDMPHASAARELRYSKKIIERLSQSAKQVIFSSPESEGDKILRPSELILGIPQSRLELPTPESPHFLPLEYLDDSRAPAVSSAEKIKGGSWILKQQSLCPFRAFASVRLNAETLPDTQLGLDQAERGILLHRCLEKIWQTLRDHKNLIAKSAHELEKIINPICESVLESFKNQQIKPSEKFLKTEKIRLQKLLLQWLELEKTRRPFTVVATENRFNLQIGKLPLRVQVDRIDLLENNQYVIIDYKTGNCQIKDWMGERPLDPQLPLYCRYTHFNEQPYSGLSFAEIKAGKLQFKGLINGENESLLPGISASLNWDLQLQQWQQSIEQLSEEFSQGQAEVNPQDPSVCDYCDLKTLCRIS